MASSQSLTVSFMQELLTGTHNFATGGDVFRLALFSSSATMNASTMAYSTDSEIVGSGYTAGGNVLTNIDPAVSGIVAYANFSDTSWPGLTATGIRYGLIYNATKAGKAVAVLDFGGEKSANNQTFPVVFPPGGATAIISITFN